MFEVITVVLLVIIIILLLYIVNISKKIGIKKEDIKESVLEVWNSELSTKVGKLEEHAREMKEMHKSLEQMLRVPSERGAFGEIALENILNDQLPPDMVGIRKKIFGNKIPDAYIKSTVGIICIDSKFPLDNYRKMIESYSKEEKEEYKKLFFKDIEGHLQKIAKDYICPENGSADFAFAYIPSEGVYWFLVSEGYDLLRDYARQGVLVVSPLTLSHKIELIKAGVHSKRLSEEAEKIKNELVKLSKNFSGIDEKWQTLYQTHIKNLYSKAEEVDEEYRKLKEAFNNISKLSNLD
ncbi:MAG: DNA recombination protein RmuC [Nitrososphaeria archaeon]|nr:DNA recombination protein RmuC [Nitrososphaeria archaeon]